MTPHIDQPASPVNRLLASALRYASRGLYVFPVTPLAKDPPLVAWGTEASTDPERIAAWWTRDPRANIGMACGPSGIAVIDSDTRPDGNGEATLAALPPLTPTRTAMTPSGGIHRFYRGVLRTTKGGLGPFIDTRGIGGYVLLPPSRTKVGPYAWRDKRPAAALDQWVVDACGEPTLVDSVTQVPAVELDSGDIIARAIDFLQHDAPPSIEGQGGEYAMLMVYGRLKDFGVSLDRAIDLVEEYYNTPEKCQPQWACGGDADPRDRHDVKARNAWAYLTRTQPGALSPDADFGDDPADAAETRQMIEVWRQNPGNPPTPKQLRWITARSRVKPL